MLMRGDQVTLRDRNDPFGPLSGTVTGILNGLVIVAWRFGNTTTHKASEVRRA